MMLHRVSLSVMVLWQSVDDQCVAFNQRLSHRHSGPVDTSDDDFIPHSLIYRTQAIDDIRAVCFMPLAICALSLTPCSHATDLLYLLMALQL